jgi:RimJ/RimL family protein N-acetyltransferase
MSAVQIAGCSGAGKSAIAAVLARRGLASIDSDDDPFLARFVDPAGAVVVEEPAAPDFAWLARHSWAWDPARLDELIQAAAPATLYVCGGADNQLELADRFTQVFLLEIDEPTMLARLDARRDHHAWGRIGDTREYLRRKLPELQARLRASGAIPIDAGRPLDHVVDAILSRTLAIPALYDDVVVLNRHTDQDVPAHLAGEDEETARRFGWWPKTSTPATVRDAFARWAHHWETGGPTRAFATREQASGRLVGGCELRIGPSGSAEVSYWTNATDRGRGYSTRSLVLLLDYARSIGIRDAEAHIAADNGRSRRVAEKAGFLPAGTFTEEDGTDMVRYQIHLTHS